MRPLKIPSLSGGLFPKLCSFPTCHSLIMAGFSVCPDCGHVFPDPERQKHEAQASSEGILTGQSSATEYEVEEVAYSIHHKRGAPDDAPRSMRVEYKIGWRSYQSEWVCFEHFGFARRKAEQWWSRRSNVPVPDTTAEAVALAEEGALCETTGITVTSKAGEKFDKISGHELGAVPDWREPGWDDEPEFISAADTDYDDVPF